MFKFPDEAKKTITRPIPSQLIKERSGGGKQKLSYISGSTVNDILNEAFGYLWSWEAEKEWVEEGYDFFNQYAKGDNLITYNGKKGVWEKQGPVAHVKGRLTVYIQNAENLITIVKTGYGSKSILGKQNDQESIFKAAGTDALKKAASLLGIGLELYRDEDEQDFFNQINYEDLWTEEAIKEYADEREYIRGLIEQYELDESDFAPYIQEFSNGTLFDLTEIIPDNIREFVNFMKSKQDNSEETGE